jgi:small subunit ribosomal protein S6
VRRYETIFILRPDLGESQTRQSLKRVEDIVANGGGDLIETDEWGIRELAYRIKRERRGYYIRLDYVAPGPVMNEVERNLKLMDESLRHLSVMVEEEADPAKLRGEVEARRRRLAEARVAPSAPEPRAADQARRGDEGAIPEAAPAAQEASAVPEASAVSEAPAAQEPPATSEAKDSGAEHPAASREGGDGADQN